MSPIFFATPAADTNGHLFVTSNSGTIYKFSTSGSLLSSVKPNAFETGAPAIASDGAMWVSLGVDILGSTQLARWRTDGTLELYYLPIYDPTESITAPAISAITRGPDGNLWYTRGAFVGKITGY